MTSNYDLRIKENSLLLKKKKWNLAFNLLISILGISSLFIKFFLVDGVIAFRAFTVDGNFFTTIVCVVATIVNIKEVVKKQEMSSKKLFYFQLASAVTEAVIFIVVMIGYLPFFADDPKITPYHMFCLHVAIPVLAVVKFIFFEKPQGILAPVHLLRGSIPIGVYGVGVITAIKLGILPQSLIPYSFLDFKSNFLWFFMFALIVIPSFGFLWSWLFYRLNIRTSLLWYSKEDLDRLNADRVKAMSNFDTVNSSILLIYCAVAILVLMFSFLGTSKTSTEIQVKDFKFSGFFILDDYSRMLNEDPWMIKDGALYKGDIYVGDGTENYNKNLLTDDILLYEASFYVQARDLSPEVAKNYDVFDYVNVNHSAGHFGPLSTCGEVLDKELVSELLEDENHLIVKQVKVDNVKYYYLCMSFGATMSEAGVGVVTMYLPASELMTAAKEAELSHDVTMIAIVVATFALLYGITNNWIKTLEKSFGFVKEIASGKTPEEPIKLGKRTKSLSGLERVLNVLWEINKDR